MAKIEWICIKQAVDLTGTSEKTLRRKAKSKKFRSKYVKGKFGRELRFAKEDVLKDVQAVRPSGHDAVSLIVPEGCDTPPGQPGTTPLEPVEGKASASSPITSPPAPLRVILVDDSEEMIKFLISLFGKMKAEIIGVALNGPSALEKLVAEQPDLVVAEMALPGMDGFSFSKEKAARKEIRDIPLVFLSYLKERASVQEGRQCPGVQEYFSKPLIGLELTRFRKWIRDFHS
jgi:CheY-like chemotaxis protein